MTETAKRELFTRQEEIGTLIEEFPLYIPVTKAAELLRETRRTTQDIIFAVGYENTSYFYRAFRARFGVTPRDYRREHGERYLPRAGGKDKK